VRPVATETVAENRLVQYLQSQDERGLELLYKAYSATLYGVILRIVKQELLAEEILQECMVKVWASFHLYDVNKGRLFTWLINIARHLAIDQIRTRTYLNQLKSQSLETSSQISRMVHSGFRPEHIGIRALTDKLLPDHKKIIDLMYFEGYTQKEIAREFQIPLGTVKTKARKAIQMLRKLI
jgi:RNA polymerase sigma-70 factor (ECF subfamily)